MFLAGVDDEHPGLASLRQHALGRLDRGKQQGSVVALGLTEAISWGGALQGLPVVRIRAWQRRQPSTSAPVSFGRARSPR